ncbi:MAG: hypothetical protein RI947_821 [Candidatus Parcubacteria bacterium]|jgi:dual specificity MAP kinase phosphatase
MNKIRSLYLIIVITFQRAADHLWRWITGLPQLKRSQISGDVFLGGQYGIRAVSTMKKLGITGIINMRLRMPHKEQLEKTFHLCHLPTTDRTAPTMQHLKTGVKFAADEISTGGKVYIHCHYGEGRGATMAIAYLLSLGLTLEDAYSQVRKVRTFINPTKPQMARLKEFEKSLKS